MSGRNLTGHEAPEAKVPAEEAAFLGAPTNTGAGDHSTPAMDSESSASAGRISWSPDYGTAERLASQAQSLVGKERLYKQSLEAQFNARIRDLEERLERAEKALEEIEWYDNSWPSTTARAALARGVVGETSGTKDTA